MLQSFAAVAMPRLLASVGTPLLDAKDFSGAEAFGFTEQVVPGARAAVLRSIEELERCK